MNENNENDKNNEKYMTIKHICLHDYSFHRRLCQDIYALLIWFFFD